MRVLVLYFQDIFLSCLDIGLLHLNDENVAHFLLTVAVLLICGKLTAQTQNVNPWLDSSQFSRMAAPAYFVNGIISNRSGIDPNSIASVSVVRHSDKPLDCPFFNGCIYIGTKNQSAEESITAQTYLDKHKLPKTIKSVVYMIDGIMVPDTLRIARSAIHSIVVLLGSNVKGVPSNSACLSIWTENSQREESFMKHKGHRGIRIRGGRVGK